MKVLRKVLSFLGWFALGFLMGVVLLIGFLEVIVLGLGLVLVGLGVASILTILVTRIMMVIP